MIDRDSSAQGPGHGAEVGNDFDIEIETGPVGLVDCESGEGASVKAAVNRYLSICSR